MSRDQHHFGGNDGALDLKVLFPRKAEKGDPAMREAAEVKALAGKGVGATEIAQRLGIGRASVYGALKVK